MYIGTSRRSIMATRIMADGECNGGVPQHFERNVCEMIMNSARNPRFMEFIQAIDTQHEPRLFPLSFANCVNIIEDKPQRNYIKYLIVL